MALCLNHVRQRSCKNYKNIDDIRNDTQAEAKENDSKKWHDRNMIIKLQGYNNSNQKSSKELQKQTAMYHS